jgi:hypothetical protein
MVGHSQRSVAFFERDLKASLPACVSVAAAALACGFRFLPKPSVCYEDVTFGAAHIRDFRGAADSGRKLERVIYFTFLDALRVVEGDRMFVDQFAARCGSDAAFWRVMRAYPLFERCRVALSRNVIAHGRSLCASAEDRPGRRCIVPLGGDPAKMAWFSNRYETV